MSVRKRRVGIKNYKEQEDRLSRQFVDVVKALFLESKEMLREHTFYYRKAKSNFTDLVAAYDDIEKQLIDDEINRPVYQRSPQLSKDYTEARESIKVALKEIRDIKSGKAGHSWELEALRIKENLHLVQLESLKSQNASDIQNFKNLRTADTALRAMSDELDKATGLCVPSKKHVAAQRNLASQEKIVENLEATMNARYVDPKVSRLQINHQAALANAQYYKTHHDALLAAARDKLAHARASRKAAVLAINAEQAKHYSALNPKMMHGVLRVYDAFSTYKSSFEAAVRDSISNKDEAADYLLLLNAREARLEKLVGKLWCPDAKQMNAKALHNELLKMSHQERKDLLAEKPSEGALAQILGMPKVSSVGMFKKPVAPETAEKRKFLLKTPGEVDGRVVYKI